MTVTAYENSCLGEAASGSMALLSNATNLPETPTVNGASHSQGYTWSPMSGITIEAHINGNVSTGNNAVTYTTTANQADKLIFGSVAWKNSGALLVRPANITFSGAAVDTMLLPGLPLILPPVLLQEELPSSRPRSRPITPS